MKGNPQGVSNADWIDYREKLLARIGELSELTVGTVSIYQSFVSECIGASHWRIRLNVRAACPRPLLGVSMSYCAPNW
jgi:hypothetical protein